MSIKLVFEEGKKIELKKEKKKSSDRWHIDVASTSLKYQIVCTLT